MPSENGPTSYAYQMLMAMQGVSSGRWYAGTVPAHVKAERRRKNKAARVARRVNRAR
jgi:hypothetical protein